MQTRYMRACLMLPYDAVAILEDRLALPKRGALFFRLAENGIDQATAVLTLLSAGHRAGAELLMGRPITIGPPCLSKRFDPVPVAAKTGDDAFVIAYVSPVNPHHKPAKVYWAKSITGICPHDRFAVLKPGMTVARARRKGVTERDLDDWSSAGKIRIEKIGEINERHSTSYPDTGSVSSRA